MTFTPEELAQRCAEAMWREDRASQALGMSLDAVGPGTATLSMTVGDTMINGHEICHGGLIFTLADSAFAFACNAYNKVTVAQHCAITFLAPAKLGDRLTARAQERTRQGRSGIYDIQVTKQDGSLVAEFRGHSRNIQGHLVPELEEPEAEEEEAS